MKTIGIMGAMDLEIELLRANMELAKEEKVAGFNFYIGKIGGKSVIVTCCGVGKVNAAACTQLLIDRYRTDYIINTGIAGGLHQDVKICDVVVSKDVTYHDVRKAQMKSLFPFRESFEGDKDLVELALRACQLNKSDKWNHHLGRIVSGEAFVSDSTLKRTIIEQYSPHCVEMEGAAIGHVAHINGVPFVVIRSISDNADDQANISYEAFEKIAAEQAANIILNMLRMM